MLPYLLAGVVAGLAVAMPLGAVGSYLVGLAAREPLRTAAAAALGVASVDGAYALVAAAGGAGLRHALGRVLEPLTVLAAGVLVLVAVRTLVRAWRRHREPTGPGSGPGSGPALTTPGRAYLGLLAVTAVNPATVLTFSAVALSRPGGAAGSGAGAGVEVGAGAGAEVALFALGALTASAGWQLLLVAAGSALGRVLRGPTGQLVVAVGSAALMLGLAAATLLR